MVVPFGAPGQSPPTAKFAIRYIACVGIPPPVVSNFFTPSTYQLILVGSHFTPKTW